MKLATLAIGLLLPIGVIGCVGAHQRISEIAPPPANPPLEKQDPTATAVHDGFRLDAGQLAELIAKANRGDYDAAFRLSLHYMTLKQTLQMNYWSLVASAGGQTSAQYNRWFDAKEKTDCASRVEALAWLKVAALSGEEPAVEKLAEFERSTQICFR